MVETAAGPAAGSAGLAEAGTGPKSAAAVAHGSLLVRWWPELAALVLWSGLWVALGGMPVSHDVVWEMWIGRQLLGGTHLYSQIMEANPPLWYWMAIPVQQMARLLGVAPAHAIVAAVFVYIGVAVALVDVLVAGETTRARAALLVGSLLASVVIPINYFGQREHLLLVAALPYLTLVARRAEGRPVPGLLAFAVGLLAAPAFALKHYFVLVPLALEIWLVLARRRSWTPWRPEILALAGAAICYGAAVLLITPEYLTVIVPLLETAYSDYGSPLDALTRDPHLPVWLLAGLVLLMRRKDAPPAAWAAAVAAGAFALCYLVQHKWWGYQALPITGSLCFALAALLAGRPAWSRTQWLRSGYIGATLALTVAVGLPAGPYSNESAPYVDALLAGSRPGTSAIMLTGYPSRIWPMIDQKGLKWPSRYFAFWMLHAIYAYQGEHGALSGALTAVADTVRRQTVDDLLCNPPDLILVDAQAILNSPDLDILAFFEKDPDFRTILSSYDKAGSAAVYTSYARKRPLQLTRPPDCRTVY